MVTNKLISNTIADKLSSSQALKDKVSELSKGNLLVIEGMNLEDYKRFNDDGLYKDVGAIITIDPIGREDNKSSFDFNVVIQVIIVISNEILPSQDTIAIGDNRIVYNGFFSLEEIILKTICLIKDDLNFGDANLEKVDYETMPLEYMSNDTYYKGFVSLMFSEEVCWRGEDCND